MLAQDFGWEALDHLAEASGKYEYDDMAVVKFMLEGVPIVGKHGTPACYPEKVKASSVWIRKAALGRGKGTTEGDHVDHLEQTAGEEISLSFVEGPFESEEQVTAYFGHDRWSVRRFVLVQGAEMKLHPIGDCREVLINQGFTSSSYLKLQDIDYIAGMALCVPPLIAKWEQQVGDQLICQIELYALVVIRWMLTNRKSIWRVDN